MKKILYLSPFFAYGGATKSLIELLTAFKSSQISAHVVVGKGISKRGWFSENIELTEAAGLVQWDNTRFGYYRRLRWLILLRELVNVWATRRVSRQLLALHRQEKFDLIHCNEITLLPSAIMIKQALGIPLVVHVRSLQAEALAPLRTAFINKAIRRYVDSVVAIDHSVARTLDPDLHVEVIYNSMAIPESTARTANHDRPLTFGIIGSLAISKGVMELLQACVLLKQRGVPFRLLVVGENVRSLNNIRGRLMQQANLSHDIEADALNFINNAGLEREVEMLGFVKDVERIYSQLDVLCFTSLLDAPGRPVFEAALHGVPSIVAQRFPTSDVIEHNETGLVIDRPHPELIAEAMEKMHLYRSHTHKMGSEARARALNRFDSQISAKKMIALYNRVLSQANDLSSNKNFPTEIE